MTKFNTTNSNLFTNKNKEVIPDWMQNLTDNLMIKEREIHQLDVEKRGIFAENQQVYRTELTADPRYLENTYGESKLLADSKIMLAKFLSGKYYNVVTATPGTNYISLSVKLDSVPANFHFPFEVKASKLAQSPTFYVDESEYPFSKAGLEECISDIKNGILKTSSKPEAIGKTFVINREEIIRRYNGSLRQATDMINQHLSEGSIIGAGSNSYASFMDIDQLFPQMEKQAGEERMSEFHFAPNQEHVATNEFKPASVLAVEASKILNNHFSDFKITASARRGNNLLVRATVLTEKGVRAETELTFAIENEKVASVREVKNEKNTMDFTQFINSLNSIENAALNKYLSTNKSHDRIASGAMLTKKDITAKLFKVVEASQIDSVVNTWIEKGLISPVNSSTYATNHTFEELLAGSNLNVMSSDAVEEIETYEKHFGQGLEVETDLIKPADEVREVEDKCGDDQRLFNANSHISKRLKQYKVSSFKNTHNDIYLMNIEFVDRSSGTRNNVPFEISFDGSKVKSCVAILGDKKVNLDKLAGAFANNKVLSLYLQDKNDNLNAGPIVISTNEMKKRLASVVTSSKIDSILNSWIDGGKVSLLNSETLASENSFEELLATVSDEYVISNDEKSNIEYRKQHFGKEIKVDTDNNVEDTGVREAEENWSSERKLLAASKEIGKFFKDFSITTAGDVADHYYATASIVNPISGSKGTLGFKFILENTKVGSIYALNDGTNEEDIPVSELNNILQRQASAASKQFAQHNRVSERSHNVIISKSNLESKLASVVTHEQLSSVIEQMTKNNLINQLNSISYASEYTLSELISKLNLDEYLQDAKEEMKQATRDEHKLSLSEKHLMDSDSRELQASVRELTPQMITAKEKLTVAVYKAEANKKITAKKSELFLNELENSKTAQDLEEVAKKLRSYLK